MTEGQDHAAHSAQGRHITQEPLTIANHLLGLSLATFRRRMFAFVCDTVLFGLLTGLLFLGLTAWRFHRDDPTLFGRINQAAGGGGA